jgi:hypothetical protein
MDQFDQQIEQAKHRAAQRLARDPRAMAAHYDAERNRIVISLSSNHDVAFAPELAQGLAGAAPADLSEIEIDPSGYGLHFPKLDADLWVPALLEGMLGSRAWIAAQLGAQGGKATSTAKAAAARNNGKLGGRPRVKATTKSTPARKPARVATAKPATKLARLAIKAKSKTAKHRRRISGKRRPASRKRA